MLGPVLRPPAGLRADALATGGARASTLINRSSASGAGPGPGGPGQGPGQRPGRTMTII